MTPEPQLDLTTFEYEVWWCNEYGIGYRDKKETDRWSKACPKYHKTGECGWAVVKVKTP